MTAASRPGGGGPAVSSSGYSTQERRLLLGISITLGLRQLVLLLALPLIAVYGTELAGGTPALAGLALGIYGLLQAVFQVPFGRWSDSYGRKRLVLLGTALLIVGLVLAAVATDVTWFIVGRALQGCGAITGVAYAWIADNTAENRRNQAMSMVALAAGGAAIVSFLAGPLLYSLLSLPQIFLLCAVLASFVWVYVFVGMKDQPLLAPVAAAPAAQRHVMGNPLLRRLVAAGFLLNYVLMAVCFVVPLLVARTLGVQELWKVFIPATLIGIAAMRVATRLADAGYFAVVAPISFAAFALSGLFLLIGHTLAVAIGTALFMSGYLALAALLPAAVTRLAGPQARGSATGAFYTAMFLGAFAGGALTGLLWEIDGSISIYMTIAASAIGVLLIMRLTSAQLQPDAADLAPVPVQEKGGEAC